MNVLSLSRAGCVALIGCFGLFVSESSAQFLMMPDSASANNRLVLFDPNNGALVNSNYFALAGATNSTPLHAMQVGNEIWVSEQVGDRVARYSLTGTPLGQIGGGVTGGMDNVRGMEQVGNTVYLTNGGAGNGSPGAASVITISPAGTTTGFFLTTGQAPSPFGALDHNGALLVSSSSANDDIHNYTYAGASLGTFHNTTLSFIEQMDHDPTGNVLAAVFTTGSVATLNANTGALISSFTASGARGVAQLGNGNVLWSNGSGAWVFDVGTQTSTLVYATTGGRYFDTLDVPEPATGALLAGAIGLLVVRSRRR